MTSPIATPARFPYHSRMPTPADILDADPAVYDIRTNAAGEHLFANVLGLHYFVARVVTSIIVSNA